MTASTRRVQTASVARILGWALALIGVISMGLSAALELSHSTPRDMSVLELIASTAAVLIGAVLGVRILQRYRRHGLGWLLVLMSLVGGLLTLAEVYAFDAFVIHRGPTWGATAADVFAQPSWVVAYAALSLVALLFPSGRIPGPGWRPLAWACALLFPAAIVLITVQPGPQDEPFAALPNPGGIAWVGTGAGQTLTGLTMVLSLACMAGCVASLFVRFVAADTVERQQIKALLYSAALTPVAFIACLATGSDGLASIVLPLALALVPLAVGLAVLRYRLYDVDRLINRTVLYVVLTALLALAYVGISVAVQLVAPSPLATAIATALVVLAFRPLRDVAQTQIDRRFARSSARARVLLRAFTDDLRHGRRSPVELEEVLGAAFDDPHLSLRFWLESPGWYVDGNGVPALEGDGWVPLGAAAQIRSTTAAGAGLLFDTVVRESALVLEVSRLNAEVRAQMALVADAQVRIATAGFEERRRVERDLHDGAQQRLLSLGLQLRRLQRSLPAQAKVLEPALDAAVEEIGRTIADLRRLAGGVAPASLANGLGSALAELAAGLPVPCHVDLPSTRLPERVEAAAYFVACEAVANAVKHAEASRIELRAVVVDDALHLVVTDDGQGGARAAGSGLSGLADRVRAHGGTFALDSPVGRGTTLEAVIPCGS
ncbi:MAG: putative two-component system sensor kinase [Marmoricola sp.]|nr:putative two-component system sensor kinase [Marmoricola sp.]